MRIIRPLHLALVFSAIVAGIFSLVPMAEAHVLIKDDTKKIGAIFHVTPDDDPVAGEQSTLYFDVQDSALSANNYRYVLKIYAENSNSEEVKIVTNGNSASANYTFPQRGLYDIRLTLLPIGSQKSENINFGYSQRVSRGVNTQSIETNMDSNNWTEPVTVFSFSVMAVLVIFAFNKRSDIVRYSKFGK